MLKIRNEQMAVFEQDALRKFEDEMVEHIKNFAPKHFEVLGEPGVRTVIRLGIERSKKYGLTNRGPVRFYIELMFMFGSDFDTDPQLPWASSVLNDEEIPDQTLRADRLYDGMTGFLDKTGGPNHEYIKQALTKIRRERFEDLQIPSENFETTVLKRLKGVYPQKFEYVGEPVLRDLIRRAGEQAKSFSISTNAGVVLFTGSMFAMGHGFATDPLLPWIAATLNKDAIGDPNKRAERLHSRMMTYLDHVLAGLGR